MNPLWLLVLAALLVSCWLTGKVRQLALARRLLDIPNARSSHRLPTPRGGGLAMVVTFLGGISALALLGHVDVAFWAALTGAGAAVAAVGWVDDHGHVATRWRLLTHTLAAAWALAWLGGLPAVPLSGIGWAAAWAGAGLGVLALVWLLNLYNFMDGIDGLAGAQAVTVGAGAAALMALLAPQPDAAWPGALLAASAAGFLWWNRPPARIFMGDVGSGFLGIAFGILALQAGWLHTPLLWGWTILLGAFIVDASLTLWRRLLARQRLDQAHRTHAYQHLAQSLGSHGWVTAGVAVVNLGWLWPWAWATAAGRVEPWVGFTAAWTPLVLAAWHWRAGLPARDNAQSSGR